MVTGLTDRVSVASDGRQADLESYQPSISDDGRFVAFVSASQSFDDRDRDVDLDVYVYDRVRDELSLVGRDLSGAGGNDDSLHPVISGDGSTIAFASAASNLFPGDVNGQIDLFVSDRAGGPVRRITQGDGPSWRPSLSEDGSQVLFVSHASNLVAGDVNVGPDLFVFDRDLGSLRLLGQSAGEQTSHFTLFGVLSGDASAVAFASDGSELIDGDDNGRRDIFVQQLTGVHRVEVTGIEEIVGLDFGNRFFLSAIQGQKFDDANGNGQRDVDPDSGDFIEPGLNGWTIRLVDQRTGETWETVTSNVDLDADGSIDPITETGIYQFGPLEPGDYELYEITQDGWLPTFPRLQLSPAPVPRRPVDNQPPIALG